MRNAAIRIVGSAVSISALLASLSTTLEAQDVSARPTYGTLDLEVGFSPDPQVVSLSAGGTHRSDLAGCTAYIHAAAPDVDINYDAGSLPLILSAASQTDVVLLVNTPDGEWHCNDDGGGGTDASLTFESPLSGNYNVWVGTYASRSGDLPAATLYVSELESGGDGSVQLDWRASPTYGTVDLSTGFRPDPFTRSVFAGGADAVPSLGSECRGYVNASAPDVDLNFQAGGMPLNIYVSADTDVTLVINRPDGSWICSDDVDGSDPRVVMQKPQSGNYNIWIGTYSPSTGTLPASVLYVSELSPNR